MSSKADADALMEQAQKHLNNKTFMFKKSPEYDKAADCFQKAAQIYRSPTVKAFDQAVAAFQQAADAHAASRVHFNAATALENAGNILRDNKDPRKAAEFYKRSVEHYKSGDNIEKACEALLKAARAVADEDADQAADLYIEAIDLYAAEDRHIFIGDSWRQCLNLLIKNSKLSDGVKLLEKMFPIFQKLEQQDYMNKGQLSVVVIKLAQSDVAGAAKACDTFGDFALSDQGAAARELIEAFEAGDVDKVKALAATQTFTLLENQVARLAARLWQLCQEQEEDMTGARESAVPAKPAAKSGVAVFHLHELDGPVGPAATGASAAAAEDDDDDMC